VAEFVGSSNVIDGAAALDILGAARTASVRPEKVRIGAIGSAVDGVRTDGTVRELVYAGSETKVVVDADPGVTLTALLLNDTDARSGFARGARVTLSWRADATRFLD
jgi:putative spermidine/putrescine transport system ATP-binding protein